MNNWRKVTLGEVCEFVYGKALTANNRIIGNIPVYSSAGITGWHNKPLVDSKGIIVGRKGSVGTVYLSETPFYCIDTAYYILPKDDIYNFKYLFYRLKSLGLNKLNEDSAVPGLNRDNAYSQKFNLPTIDEQKRIADVLSALDDKIEINNKINENLEAQAQAIFKQWFVDEAEENWEEKPISYFGNVVCGKTPSKNKKEYFGGEIPFIKIPDMHGNAFIINTADTLTEAGKLSQENKTLPYYSICVSCIATVGLVSMNIIEAQTNQQINSIIPFKEEYRYYLYLKLSLMYEYLNSIARGGTATLNLNTNSFMNIKISLPNNDKLDIFHKIVSPIFKEILNKMEENKNLSEIRNSLLPKLLSGEVRV